MYTYLALGDSYTIGEQVPLQESYPYQTAALLRQEQIEVADPVIIAKTGWTTDELAAAIREHNITDKFSFVSLLIGVNNQYRGRSVENYEKEFESLLQQAITFAEGRPERVFVLSIPDWGATPFAEGKDRELVAREIDTYNAGKKRIALAIGCSFLDITESTRKNALDPSYITEDKLHLTQKEYRIWAEQLAPMIAKALKLKQ